MDKTELLFTMMERPEDYTDQQWLEVLADDECRELYTTMSKVKSAIDADRIDQQMDAQAVEKEWQAFQAHHRATGKAMPMWRNVAAAILAAIAFCGITIAAVHHFNQVKHETPAVTVGHQQTESQDHVQAPQNDINNDAAPGPRLYDNVPLEEVINDLATNYGVQVEWRSDEARSLRLYYQWEPSFTLGKVVEMLNNFEAFSIAQEGDKLIIEQTDKQQSK